MPTHGTFKSLTCLMIILFLPIFSLLIDLKTAEAHKEIKILKYKQILEKYLQISSELDPKMMAFIPFLKIH